KSGLLEGLRKSEDPQDETRVENLGEFVSVATEFVAAVSAVSLADTGTGSAVASLRQTGLSVPAAAGDPTPVPTSPRAAKPDQDDEAAFEAQLLAEAAVEPDPSLPAFLERVALVADSDQLPDADDQSAVTLMTMHSAKGLEFDTVFITGLEDGIFPHVRALEDPTELEEERRLAYVGITRAMKRLYLTRATVRILYGQPHYNPPSRYLDEIPGELLDWRRLGAPIGGWSARSASTSSSTGRRLSDIPAVAPAKKTASGLSVGDLVLHATFGLGIVQSTLGTGLNEQADIDFGSAGKKRLMLRFAPMEKLS
ncbi:MAG: ATP-binding domain-containing protein, partial [Propionibacteriaceae bacterium]|nr:ATP-binding domain-containing protein [Propionibacteriaceae bacterium]